MSAFLAVIARDLRLARRQGTDVAMTLAFFVVVVAMFPLGLGPCGWVHSQFYRGFLTKAPPSKCLRLLCVRLSSTWTA